MRVFLRTAGAILMLFGVCLLGIITSSLFNEKIALGVESTVSALSEAVAEAADRPVSTNISRVVRPIIKIAKGIYIHFSVFLVFGAGLFFGCFYELALAFLTALIHECAHLLCAVLFKGKVRVRGADALTAQSFC